MKLRKRFIRILAGVMAAALFFAPATAHAAVGDRIDATKSCAVSLDYKDRNGKGISGMRVRVYQIATVAGEVLSDSTYTVKYTLTPEFRQYEENGGQYPVTGFSEEALNEALKTTLSADERAARWQNFAVTLAPYAQADVQPKGSKRTQDDGTVSFTGLRAGLYLLVADGALVKEEDADYRYTYHPTVLALPRFANGEWIYGSDTAFDLSNAVHPKCTYERIEREEFEYSIFKRWVNDGGIARPVSIVVDLYRDGVLYERVTLNEENNWRYDWKSDSAHSWYAVERTTNRGYSVTMNITGRAITFTNTYNPPPPPENPPPENPPPENPPDVLGARRESEVLGVRRRGEAVLGSRRLPQSGQLWWPVPVMAFFGVLLFATGAAKRRKSGDM